MTKSDKRWGPGEPVRPYDQHARAFRPTLIGLINGSFYALLSLGLAVIFGMLTIVNFAHGDFYMMGAFGAYFLLQYAGLSYWWALILSPLVVGAIGAVAERLFLKRLRLRSALRPAPDLRPRAHHPGPVSQLLRRLRHALFVPKQLTGAYNLGFMFLPVRWVILASAAVCFATWLIIEKTKLVAYLRARPRTRPWCAPSKSTCRAW